MEHIKISLVDNDYVVHAKTDIEVNGHNDPVKKFLRQISAEENNPPAVFDILIINKA